LNNTKLEWYTYSQIGSFGLDYVVLKKNLGRKRILKSGYVSDIYFKGADTIFIQLYKNSYIEFNKVNGFVIILDTLGHSINSSSMRGRQKNN